MSTVLLEIKNSVAVVTLNRPEKFNAFNREMALSLQKTLDDCAAAKNVRCVFLTGNGKAFCAGQDLSEFSGEDAPLADQMLREYYNPIVSKIRQIEKPIVCAVNGVAAGAGANIALCCDIVVASNTASFIQAFSKIGLIPDSGGTFILPRLIGFQKASAIMMLGEKISAIEAERIGMIYKIFSEETFMDESMKIADTLFQMPTKGLSLTKQALNKSFTHSFEEQLKLEEELQAAAARTDDYREGVKAFLEKRTPVFKGE